VVTVNALPTCSITGTNAVCANSTGITYAAPAGMSAYVWSISGNGTITSATDTQSITVTAGAAGSFTLSLTVTNGNGCSSSCLQIVTVNDVSACSITGTNSVCTTSTGNTYSAPASMNGYRWSISGNGSIVGATNTQSISVTAGAAGSFTLSLTITNNNGCTSTCNLPVTVNSLPSCTITGTNAVCTGADGIAYSAPAGPSGYSWSISGNGTITSATDTQSITVTAGAAGSYTLSVTTTNASGCTSTCNQVVTVNALPTCSITGTNTVCANSPGITYTGPAGMSVYVWSISGNGTITSATNTQSITVTD
jgi:hypothetical protein